MGTETINRYIDKQKGHQEILRTQKARLYPRIAEVYTLETLLTQGREVYIGSLAECKLR